MKWVIRSVLLSFLFALTNAHWLQSQNDYATPILAGISNHGQGQGRPYVTAGDRAYLIGTQDGNFPDMGEHVPGEMGGLWLHPIKLIDGFWATVTDLATHQETDLSESTEFVNYPYGNRFRYGRVSDSLEILPTIPPAVTTSSPFWSDSSIAFVSLERFCCGRMRRK